MLSRLVERILFVLFGLAMLLPAAFFGILWHGFYWRHRDCIEEAWRTGANGCWVSEEGVNYSGGAAILIWPALIFLALATGCFYLAARVRSPPPIGRK
jgi:hypothetical protein